MLVYSLRSYNELNNFVHCLGVDSNPFFLSPALYENISVALDIVKSINKYNGGTTIGKVYFEDSTWFGAKDYLDYINKFCLIEVIGNIHDNQELLK